MDYLRPLNPAWVRESTLDSETMSRLQEQLVLRSEWSVNDAPPHFLKTFVNYRDGQLTFNRHASKIIPEEFKSGQTNSRLDVLSWTNVASLTIPVRARLLGYIRDTNDLSGPLLLNITEQFEVTNITAGTTRRHFIPGITAATRILDYRAAIDPHRPAEYYSTNGIIIDDPEEAVGEMERQQEESRRRREARKQAERQGRPKE